jgi:hypothetical protein
MMGWEGAADKKAESAALFPSSSASKPAVSLPISAVPLVFIIYAFVFILPES